MNYTVPGIVTAAVLVVILVGGVIAWRRRRARQAGYDAVEPTPVDLGAVAAEASVLYLATTPDGARYERISVGPVGFRARGTVTVADAGVLVALTDREFFVPAPDLRDAGRASWTIDRGIAPDGLVRLGWTLGGRAVDSFFRFDDEEEVEPLLGALAPLLAVATPTTTTTTTTDEEASR